MTMNTAHVKALARHYRRELRRQGWRIKWEPTKELEGEAVGYCDDVEKCITIAGKSKRVHFTLFHEFAHFQQWLNNCPLYWMLDRANKPHRLKLVEREAERATVRDLQRLRLSPGIVAKYRILAKIYVDSIA